jgi:hypothetical protein
MTHTRMLALAAALLFPVMTACGDDDDGGTEPATEFSAILSGDEEVPPNTSEATGDAELSVDGDEITYTVNVTGLENVLFAHIHIAEEGANGPVHMNLCGTGPPLPDCVSGTGVLVSGTNGTTENGITFDSLLTAMRSGAAYVNVHTSDGTPTAGPGNFPAGEIRGQVDTE